MLLEELAEDLVSATSGLLDGRIINIMNPDGIIIASTQPERIGTFHKGARDAAVSGKPVSIRPDQIQEYSGAREGYNMPLRVGGNIIGVVGIYGEPSEIRYLAHLVEVYTEKYYQLEALIRPQYAQGALKSILLSKLLEGSAKSIAEAETLIKSRNLTLCYPVRVALLADNDGKNLTAQQAEAEFHRWESAGALSGTEDLWSLIDGRLILLLSDRPGRKAEDVQTALRLNLSLPVQAPWEIQRAYQQVLLLDSFTDSGRNLLSDPDGPEFLPRGTEIPAVHGAMLLCLRKERHPGRCPAVRPQEHPALPAAQALEHPRCGRQRRIPAGVHCAADP